MSEIQLCCEEREKACKETRWSPPSSLMQVLLADVGTKQGEVLLQKIKSCSEVYVDNSIKVEVKEWTCLEERVWSGIHQPASKSRWRVPKLHSGVLHGRGADEIGVGQDR